MPPKIPEAAVLRGHSPLSFFTILCCLLLSVLACQTGDCSFPLLTHKVWERDGRKKRERQHEELLSLLLVVIVAAAAS